jgi:hypothetical protein
MLKLVVISVVVLVLTSAALLSWLYWSFGRQIEAEVGTLKAEAQSSTVVITEAMLADLPLPAQRYLRYAGVVGKALPALVRLTQAGRIRSSNEAGWMAFEAEEYYSTNPPALVWRAYLPRRALPLAIGRDTYLSGDGSILIKMLAAFPVADEHGPELGEAGLMRFLNEMMWFPAAFLLPNVVIGAVDDASFQVTIEDRGRTATALLFIDDEGRLTNFRAQRYNTGSRSLETWETPITAYATWEGLNLPRSGSATWKLPSSDLTYIELDVLEVGYSEKSP